MTVITETTAPEITTLFMEDGVIGSNAIDYDLFHTILNVQSHSHQTSIMRAQVTQICEQLGATVWTIDGNVYAVKGDADRFPTVVAHTDTVHRIVPDDQYSVHKSDDLYFAFNPIKRSFTGIGGDDKVGIYIALVALKYLPNVKVAFFRDEEIGCVGSRVADMTFFEDSSMVLECDRRGKADFINEISGYELYGKEFKDAIAPLLRKYGYREMGGMITDVGELKSNGLQVACANMSCGYYAPHSDAEYILASDVLNTQKMVFDILALGVDHTFSHAPVRKWGVHRGANHGYYHGEYLGMGGGEWAGSASVKGKEKSTTSASTGSRINNTLVHKQAVLAEAVINNQQIKESAAIQPVYHLRHEYCPNCKSYSLFDYDDTESMWFCKECLQHIAEYEGKPDDYKD